MAFTTAESPDASLSPARKTESNQAANVDGLLEVPRCERLAKWVIRAQIPPHAAEFSASSGGDFGVPVSFSVKWKNISQQ